MQRGEEHTVIAIVNMKQTTGTEYPQLEVLRPFCAKIETHARVKKIPARRMVSMHG